MNTTLFEENKKFGFRRGDKVYIEPIFDYATSFENGLAIVKINGKYGIINENGKYTVNSQYDELRYLFDDLFCSRINQPHGEWVCGVINSKGETIVEFKFKYITNKDHHIVCYQDANSTKESRYNSSDWYYCYKDLINPCWLNAKGKLITEYPIEKSSLDYLVFRDEKYNLGVIDNSGSIKINAIYKEIEICSQTVFLVQRRNEEEQLYYSVINIHGDTIIPETLDYIKYIDGFFRISEEQEVWYNINGEKLHEGKASPLTSRFLSVRNGSFWGVKDSNKQQIINFMYDQIDYIDECFIVCRDNKIGLLGLKGEVILDTVYSSIENILLSNNLLKIGEYKSPKDFWHDYEFPGYCEEYIFDTDQPKTERLTQTKLSVYNGRISKKSSSKSIDFSKPIIASSDNFSELYLYSDGLIRGCRFDQIFAITPNHYVFKTNEHFGVYNYESRSIQIPAIYDRIQFVGGHTLLVSLNDLWGAIDILPTDDTKNKELKVHIPIEYKELKILDPMQIYFGAKKTKTFFDETTDYYTLLSCYGTEVESLADLDLQEQFKMYDKHHFLSRRNGKYGFISCVGYTSIPFIYDEIIDRGNNTFDVRVDNSWGIINIQGHELTKIKYKEKLPGYIAKEIVPSSEIESTSLLRVVSDARSDFEGCIDITGKEIIPTVYEHLMLEDSDIIYFGHGGYNTGSGGNFFTQYDCSLWGCLNLKGEIIIDAKYDCFKLKDNYILAGRNGSFLTDNSSDPNRCKILYSGVYDLYDHAGKLIIGGFRDMEYNAEKSILALFYGGNWNSESIYDDEWNNLHFIEYKFNHNGGRWLFLDENLRTIQHDKDGKHITFREGFIGTVTKKQDEGKNILYFNIPLQFTTTGFSHFSLSSIIIKEKNCIEPRLAAIDYNTGNTTDFHDDILQITDKLFFFADDRLSGIRTLKDIIIPANYIMFTLPAMGYFFGVKSNSQTSTCTVELFNLSHPEAPILTAIKEIETNTLMDEIGYGRLKMEVYGNRLIQNIQVPRLSIFDKEFINVISPKETCYFCGKWKHQYFFSTSHLLGEHKYSRNRDYDEDFDYSDII